MIALRVAELRKEAVATRAAASIEMELETSTSRFALWNIHPDAAKALREFASQVVDDRSEACAGYAQLTGQRACAHTQLGGNRACIDASSC